MLRAIIIDDERKGRMALKQKIEDYCAGIQLVGEAENGEQGLQLIQQTQPNIVFLDIQMPHQNGFEMLRKVKEKNFHVIFTTAYDQYAITAIKFAAFDYLLKPIDIEELKATIDRIAMLHESMTGPKLDALEINFREKTAFSKLAIPTIEGLLFFDVDRIVHLEAMSNYTVLYFTDGNKLTASKTLKEFEDLLPETRFFRIHHSHIINLDHIRRYIRGDGGQVVMGNGNFVDVSRRKKEEFLKKIGH